MGLECLLGRPIITTKIEVQQPTVMGNVTPGRSYLKVIEQISRFHQSRVKIEADLTDVCLNNHLWLPEVRDLRVLGNQTRLKELEDPKLTTEA